MKTRKEHDLIGEVDIPEEKYYGVHTQRAMENFNITGRTIGKESTLIKAMAEVKKAAALTNKECGVLDPEITAAICHACDELKTGKYDDQFPSDPIQGGAGTSVNMNANEVIANLALEHLGHNKGEYDRIHPNNHVNCSQSTNDTYPTAFRICLYHKIQDFFNKLQKVQQSFAEKANEFKEVLKMGRTQMQDAVPMTLGAEFNGFATTIKEDLERLKEAQQLILEVNLGATAIGTKINTPKGYSEKVVDYLAKETGLPLVSSPDLVEATSDTGAYVQIMGTLKRSAVKISKICNDLRLLSSGPRAGFNEINLPAVQPGSSIMPGKVNPVIPEVVNQTCFYVIGQDTTVTMAAEAGQLQLNVMEPVIAYAMFTSLDYFGNALNTLNEKCIKGITANPEHSSNMVMNCISIVTQLSPLLGYEICSDVAKEALTSGKSIRKIVVEEKELISEQKWNEIYSKENLTVPRFIK